MSIETWKKEFYPTSASKCSKKKALAHSLRKWMGLTAKNMKKHGLTKRIMCYDITDACEVFSINSESCALCHYYLNSTVVCPISWNNNCIQGVGCDKVFLKWSNGRNPWPMIRLLKKAMNSY